MAVLLFHCEKYVIGEPPLDKGYHLSLFCHGSMGVEFFFVVSGFLMAKSAYKKNQLDPVSFLKRKVAAIFPMHVLTFFLAFAAYVISNRMHPVEIIAKAVESIPSFFLIQMTGINLCSPNHITWYLSCMLIAMAVLYPLCRKYYQMFTCYIAPLLGILLLGYCIAGTGRLTGVAQWTGICYKSLIRALSEIALGAAGFEASRRLQQKEFSQGKRIGIAAAELLLFLCTMVYAVGTFPSTWEVIELFAILLLVVLAFSQTGAGSRFFDNRLCYHLGKISLPLYLAQVTPIYLVTGFAEHWTKRQQIAGVIAGTFVLAYIVFLTDHFRHLWKGRKYS